MMMNWHDLEHFLSMGGHGPYVWGAYGTTALLMGLEALLAARRRRQALAHARDTAEEAA